MESQAAKLREGYKRNPDMLESTFWIALSEKLGIDLFFYPPVIDTPIRNENGFITYGVKFAVDDLDKEIQDKFQKYISKVAISSIDYVRDQEQNHGLNEFDDLPGRISV